MDPRTARHMGAHAYRSGAPRACPITPPATFPGMTESRLYAECCAEWYRGWDVANLYSDVDMPS